MTRTRLALAALTAAALLSACQDDPKPKVADPTPSAPSSETPPTTSPYSSVTPTVAYDAEATVRAWVEARNAALLTGDTAAVDALSATDCRSCRELTAPIADVYAAGGRFETAGWTIKSLKQKPDSTPAQVDTALIFAPGTTVPSAGADPVKYDEEKHIVTFKLAEGDSGFQVRLVLFLS
jgi:hypothetical protein